jgi:hypothetical protein
MMRVEGRAEFDRDGTISRQQIQAGNVQLRLQHDLPQQRNSGRMPRTGSGRERQVSGTIVANAGLWSNVETPSDNNLAGHRIVRYRAQLVAVAARFGDRGSSWRGGFMCG